MQQSGRVNSFANQKLCTILKKIRDLQILISVEMEICSTEIIQLLLCNTFKDTNKMPEQNNDMVNILSLAAEL